MSFFVNLLFQDNDMAKVHRDAKQAGVENLLAANPEQKEQMVRNLQG